MHKTVLVPGVAWPPYVYLSAADQRRIMNSATTRVQNFVGKNPGVTSVEVRKEFSDLHPHTILNSLTKLTRVGRLSFVIEHLNGRDRRRFYLGKKA